MYCSLTNMYSIYYELHIDVFVIFIFISESYFLFINSRVLLLVVENENFCYHNSIPRKLFILYNRIHNTKSGLDF